MNLSHQIIIKYNQLMNLSRQISIKYIQFMNLSHEIIIDFSYSLQGNSSIGKAFITI